MTQRRLARPSLLRLHRLATRAWLALATGAGFAFLARDLAGLPALPVAIIWLAGALFGLFGLGRR